ncbi:hypothetical protein DSO57_1032993 [Entomophthora muscae]|uniref:Uncharacterized protein n=1 Tax=Entomophthora muscae TaxID=34485 RepID=A0ACC2TB69_9FUNG|nr:hypothetical protein DSO57_1032993 [Entomophthora muscae]
MITRGKEILEKEFNRCFQGRASFEARFHGGDAGLVVGKRFEGYATLQTKYIMLAKEPLHLENDIPAQLAPSIGLGHVLVLAPEELEVQIYHN